MGQKVNPNSFRIAPTLYRKWNSIVYAKKDYAKRLLEDINIRKIIFKDCENAVVGNVSILRSSQALTIDIFAKKPGLIIGKSGSDIEKLKVKLQKLSDKEIYINIHEIKKIFLDASLLAQSICRQIEGRVSFRKAMKNAIQNCLKQGAKGIKVQCSGRLGGAEIARSEWYKEGSIPLHSLRSNISYSSHQAFTTYGIIGVKVWVNKGFFYV